MGDTPEKNELDEYGVWIKTPLSDNETSTDNTSGQTADNDFGLPDFSFLDDIARSDERMAKSEDENVEESATEAVTEAEFEAETPAEPAADEAEPEVFADTNTENAEDFSTDITDEISVDDFIAGNSEDIPSPAETPAKDGEVDLSAFMDDAGDSHEDGEISVDDFMGSSGDSHADGDVDLSDFLGGGGDGEVSLDAFFGEGHTETQAQEETVVDEDPLDIDLTFEDDVPAQEEEVAYGSSFEAKYNAPDTDSTGSTELDLDAFLSDSTPVDSAAAKTTEDIPQTFNQTEEVSLDDFDSMFDSIQDESGAETASPAAAESPSSGEDESIDLSEFGIEEDSDNQNVTIGKASSAAPVQRDYEMNVSIDDEPVSTPKAETSDEGDDENISLEVKPEERTDASVKKDTDFSAPDDDFDVDSLLNSVEYDSDTSTKPEDDSSSIESFISEEENTEKTQVVPAESSEEVDVTDLFETSVEEDTSVTETKTEEEKTENPPLAEDSSEGSSAEESDDFNADALLADVMPEESVEESAESKNYEEVPLEFKDITSEEVPQESIPEKSIPADDIPEDIPDTFEEEAASLTMDNADSEENSISGDSNMTETTSPESLEILKQISSELASLKSEIETLKTEFAELKDQGSTAVPEVETKAEEEVKVVPVPFTEPVAERTALNLVNEMNGETELPSSEPANEGFFESDDDDDTIALSGDELNNILNTAEFTEAEAITEVEEPAAIIQEEPVETIEEEPVETIEEEPLEEEESSSDSIFGSAESIEPLPDTDFDDPTNNLSMNFANEQLEEPTFDQITPEENTDEEVSDLPEEISVPKVEDELVVDSSSSEMIESEVEEDSDEPFEVIAPTLDTLTPEPLTDDNIDYLNESVSEEDEELETGISEQPVEAVFDQWQNPSEPALEEDTFEAASEPVFEEAPVAEAESAEDFVVPEVSAVEAAVAERNLAEESTEDDDEDNMSVFVTGTADTVLAAGLTEEQIANADITEVTVPETETAEESFTEPDLSAVTEEAPVDEAETAEESFTEPEVVENEPEAEVEPQAVSVEEPVPAAVTAESTTTDANGIPADMKQEIKSVLAYMDQLLESLPEEKITEFAQSEQFVTYKKLFAEFGLA